MSIRKFPDVLKFVPSSNEPIDRDSGACVIPSHHGSHQMFLIRTLEYCHQFGSEEGTCLNMILAKPLALG